MPLEIIRKLLTRDLSSATEELLQLQELCKSQVNELRAFVRSMRPVDVEGSLNATLRRVVEQFQKDSGISSNFHEHRVSGTGRAGGFARVAANRSRGSVQRTKALFASRVAVSISNDNELEITVEDNGAGFPFSGRTRWTN